MFEINIKTSWGKIVNAFNDKDIEFIKFNFNTKEEKEVFFTNISDKLSKQNNSLLHLVFKNTDKILDLDNESFLLMMFKIDKNIQNKKGKTALMFLLSNMKKNKNIPDFVYDYMLNNSNLDLRDAKNKSALCCYLKYIPASNTKKIALNKNNLDILVKNTSLLPEKTIENPLKSILTYNKAKNIEIDEMVIIEAIKNNPDLVFAEMIKNHMSLLNFVSRNTFGYSIKLLDLNVNKKCNNGRTWPMEFLKKYKGLEPEILEVILTSFSNEDFMIKGDDNKILLHFIFKYSSKDFLENNEKYIETIIKNTDINIKDEYGNTPLMFAVKNESVPKNLIESCINQGADVKIKTNKGKDIFDFLRDRKVHLIDNRKGYFDYIISKEFKEKDINDVKTIISKAFLEEKVALKPKYNKNML